MKLTLRIFALFFAIAIMTSCTSMRKVMPYYTEPTKLAQLKNGMSLSQITSTLGIDPYDVYHIQDDGSSVLVFTYRIKKRRMNYTTGDDLASEQSQTNGTVWYDGEHKAYLLLNDGKLTSLITDSGREDSKAILVKNNILQLISEKDLVDIREASTLYDENAKPDSKLKGDGNSGNAIVIPLDKLNINSIDGIDLRLK